MAIVMKFFSKKLLKVDTRLLNLVGVDVETAAELVETMENDLHKHGIDIKDLVGFATITALLLASWLPTPIAWQLNVLAIVVL